MKNESRRNWWSSNGNGIGINAASSMEWNSLSDCLRDPARSTDSFRSAQKNSSLRGAKGLIAH